MVQQHKKLEIKAEKSQKKELVKTLADNKEHDNKNEAHDHSHEHAHDHSHDHNHEHTHVNEEKKEDKVEEKKTEKKEEKKIVKKEEAIAKGVGLPISKKHCMYICNFIKGKTVDLSIKQLEEVLKFKRAIPYAGEIPHRHGDMMSGRYPINASKVMITVLKGLRGNIISNGLDVEKAKIYFASPTWGSRPAKKGGMRFKRVHLILKAKEFNNKMEKKK
ncbi:MAG: hypothetical protein AABW82_03315 [Nanoarchaeota archaeon]